MLPQFWGHGRYGILTKCTAEACRQAGVQHLTKVVVQKAGDLRLTGNLGNGVDLVVVEQTRPLLVEEGMVPTPIVELLVGTLEDPGEVSLVEDVAIPTRRLPSPQVREEWLDTLGNILHALELLLARLPEKVEVKLVVSFHLREQPLPTGMLRVDEELVEVPVDQTGIGEPLVSKIEQHPRDQLCLRIGQRLRPDLTEHLHR